MTLQNPLIARWKHFHLTQLLKREMNGWLQMKKPETHRLKIHSLFVKTNLTYNRRSMLFLVGQLVWWFSSHKIIFYVQIVEIQERLCVPRLVIHGTVLNYLEITNQRNRMKLQELEKQTEGLSNHVCSQVWWSQDYGQAQVCFTGLNEFG